MSCYVIKLPKLLSHPGPSLRRNYKHIYVPATYSTYTKCQPLKMSKRPNYGEHESHFHNYGEHESHFHNYGEHESHFHNYGEHESHFHNYGEHESHFHNYGEHESHFHNYGENESHFHNSNDFFENRNCTSTCVHLF